VRAGPNTLFVAACQPPDCWGYLVLGRFQRDGSLDRSFGEHGLVRTSASGGSLEPRALAIQRDGKILVGGELWTGSARRAFLARYLPDGRPDAHFGQQGLVVSDLLPAVSALAVQSDGRIVAAAGPRVARYLGDGHPDAGFGTRGVAHIPALLHAATLVLDPHGRIIVAGSGGDAHRPVLAIARLTANGSVDRGFAGDGQVLDWRPGDHWARVETVTPRRDGSLVAAGWATRGGSVRTRHYRLVLLAIDSAGALLRFGEGGRLTLSQIEARGQAIFETNPPRLLVVGADDDLNPRKVVFATARLP
jgi:uncharacterized delta-60 repeat protein